MMRALIFLVSLLVALPSWQRADYWECALHKSAYNLIFAKAQINGVPVVSGALDGQPIKLLFDTGAPMCNLDPGVAKASIGERAQREVMIEENKFALEFRIKDLSAIKQSLGCSGVIGNNFLDRYEVYSPAAG